MASRWGYDIQDRGRDVNLAALEMARTAKNEHDMMAQKRMVQGEFADDVNSAFQTFMQQRAESNRMNEERSRLEAMARGERAQKTGAAAAMGSEDPSYKKLVEADKQFLSEGSGKERGKIAQLFLGKRPEDYRKDYVGLYENSAIPIDTAAQKQAASKYADVAGQLRAQPMEGTIGPPSPTEMSTRSVDPLTQYGSVVENPTDRVDFAKSMGIDPSTSDMNLSALDANMEKIKQQEEKKREYDVKWGEDDKVLRGKTFVEFAREKDFNSPEDFKQAGAEFAATGKFNPSLTKDGKIARDLEIRGKEAMIKATEYRASGGGYGGRGTPGQINPDDLYKSYGDQAKNVEDYIQQLTLKQPEDPEFYGKIIDGQKRKLAELYGKQSLVYQTGRDIQTEGVTSDGWLLSFDAERNEDGTIRRDENNRPIVVGVEVDPNTGKTRPRREGIRQGNSRAGQPGTISGEGVEPQPWWETALATAGVSRATGPAKQGYSMTSDVDGYMKRLEEINRRERERTAGKTPEDIGYEIFRGK